MLFDSLLLNVFKNICQSPARGKTGPMVIEAIQSKLVEEYVTQKVLSLDKTIQVEGLQKIYYPYYHVEMQAESHILGKKISGKIACLIDLIEGAETLISEEPRVEKIEVERQIVITPKLTNEGLLRKAENFLSQSISHKMKVLLVPKLTLLTERVLYRPFWLVNCTSRNETFQLLVEGISGHYHPL